MLFTILTALPLLQAASPPQESTSFEVIPKENTADDWLDSESAVPS